MSVRAEVLLKSLFGEHCKTSGALHDALEELLEYLDNYARKLLEPRDDLLFDDDTGTEIHDFFRTSVVTNDTFISVQIYESAHIARFSFLNYPRKLLSLMDILKISKRNLCPTIPRTLWSIREGLITILALVDYQTLYEKYILTNLSPHYKSDIEILKNIFDKKLNGSIHETIGILNTLFLEMFEKDEVFAYCFLDGSLHFKYCPHNRLHFNRPYCNESELKRISKMFPKER